MNEIMNPEARSAAFRSAMAKKNKIEELCITADMSEEAKETLISKLCEIKALETGRPFTEFEEGQTWYVEGLITFAGMSAEKRLESEYNKAFSEVASEEEMLAALAG